MDDVFARKKDDIVFILSSTEDDFNKKKPQNASSSSPPKPTPKSLTATKPRTPSPKIPKPVVVHPRVSIPTLPLEVLRRKSYPVTRFALAKNNPSVPVKDAHLSGIVEKVVAQGKGKEPLPHSAAQFSSGVTFDNQKFRKYNVQNAKKNDIYQQTTYQTYDEDGTHANTLRRSSSDSSPSLSLRAGSSLSRVVSVDSGLSSYASSNTSSNESTERLPNDPKAPISFDEFEQNLIQELLEGK